MLYVLEGPVTVNETFVEAFQLVSFYPGGNGFSISSGGASQVLLIAGAPLNEPIALGGPFVMNTSQEIEQAHSDYSNGLFETVKSHQ